MDEPRATDPQTGISIRFIRQWAPPTPAEELRAHLRLVYIMKQVNEARDIALLERWFTL